MNHAPSAGSMVRHVGLQSNALPLCQDCPHQTLWNIEYVCVNLYNYQAHLSQKKPEEVLYIAKGKYKTVTDTAYLENNLVRVFYVCNCGSMSGYVRVFVYLFHRSQMPWKSIVKELAQAKT